MENVNNVKNKKVKRKKKMIIMMKIIKKLKEIYLLISFLVNLLKHYMYQIKEMAFLLNLKKRK